MKIMDAARIMDAEPPIQCWLFCEIIWVAKYSELKMKRMPGKTYRQKPVSENRQSPSDGSDHQCTKRMDHHVGCSANGDATR